MSKMFGKQAVVNGILVRVERSTDLFHIIVRKYSDSVLLETELFLLRQEIEANTVFESWLKEGS